jgi:SAM-dependent methyltransferase
MGVDSLTSVRHWLEELRETAKLELYQRARAVYLETRQLASRELAARYYLRRAGLKRLRIVAGLEHREGWLDADFDVGKRFPFDDCTFDAVFSEHTIGQLRYDGGASMLRECHRVLKPGGKLRVVTGDLEAVLSMPRSNRTALQERYLRFMIDEFDGGGYEPAFLVNLCLRLTTFTYDGPLLAQSLLGAGFIDVERVQPGESREPLFRGADVRPLPDSEIDRHQSMAYEARRPL